MSLVPKAPINVEGKEFIMAFDLWAFQQFKEKTGKDLLKGASPDGIEEIIAFFWSALLREQPEITIEEVGHLLHPGNLEEVSQKLNDLYGLAQPEPTDDSGNAEGSTG
ncbi:MAG: hypothetical protein M0R06_12995 [Sphaerochaeta sp.]|jgi:hypothetical protein|nr:hypothetical protein [Sphaerochaeta sp.]